MEAYKYKPDMILLYAGRNDVVFEPDRFILNTWYKKLVYNMHTKLYFGSMLYTYIIEKTGVLFRENAKPVLFTSYENPFPHFLDIFNQLLDFCDMNKIKIVYVCQVLNCNGSSQYCVDLMNKVKQDKGLFNSNKEISTTSYIENQFRLQEIVRNISKERNIQFIDPRPEFYEAMRGEDRHYFTKNNQDSVHLTPLGNKILAGIIAKRIKDTQ